MILHHYIPNYIWLQIDIQLLSCPRSGELDRYAPRWNGRTDEGEGELSDPEDDVVISTIEVNGESPRTPKENKQYIGHEEFYNIQFPECINLTDHKNIRAFHRQLAKN